MFDNKKTLIVVYKDEILLNQIKKLIETNDDTENEVIGTKDKSISIVSWDEKTWLSQKQTGRITDKVLFIGDIKETDKLLPIVDEKFNDSGVIYGWAGNQAIINANLDALKKMEDYQNFLKKIASLQIPSDIKNANKIDDIEKETLCLENDDKNAKAFINNQLKKIRVFVKNAGIDFAVFTKDLFKDKKKVEQQMLFYGIIKFYYDDLEKFIEA